MFHLVTAEFDRKLALTQESTRALGAPVALGEVVGEEVFDGLEDVEGDIVDVVLDELLLVEVVLVEVVLVEVEVVGSVLELSADVLSPPEQALNATAPDTRRAAVPAPRLYRVCLIIRPPCNTRASRPNQPTRRVVLSPASARRGQSWSKGCPVGPSYGSGSSGPVPASAVPSQDTNSHPYDVLPSSTTIPVFGRGSEWKSKSFMLSARW